MLILLFSTHHINVSDDFFVRLCPTFRVRCGSLETIVFSACLQVILAFTFVFELFDYSEWLEYVTS